MSPVDSTPAAPAAGVVASTPELPRWRVFPVLALGTVMATLDISVVNIALPTLTRTFGVSITTIAWVVLAYVLTITGLLLALGRIADRIGRRRVYGAGLVVFTLASVACAAAPSAGALIAARAIQGLGAAMLTANSAALLIASFPAAERGRALGLFGAAVGVGLALGPPLGGLIVGHASWRWIFLINLPLGALALWMLPRRIAPDRTFIAGEPLDLGSAALWSVALVALMLGLSRGSEHGWSSAGVWPWFALALVAFAAFVVIERRARDPLLPLRLLRGPIGLAVTLTFIVQALSIAIAFHMPLYLENVLGFGPAQSGAWLSVFPLAALIVAPLSGRWSDRIGSRPLAVAGLGLTTIGFAGLATLGTAPSPGLLLGAMAAIGAGLGLFTIPNASALFGAAPAGDLGLVSGLQATMRNLGIASGSAAMAAAVATRYAAHGGGSLVVRAGSTLERLPFALATRDAYAGMTGLAVVATLLALRQGPPQRRSGAALP
jgi:EmrB/QacA subfamily drug resistance transporter